MLCLSCLAQEQKILPVENGEYWYGLAVSDGDQVPFSKGYSLNLNANVQDNQASPLLLSSKGRYIWNDNPFACVFGNDSIILSKYTTAFTIGRSGNTLKAAYLEASRIFFPAQKKMPDSLLFSAPQYNTWIELIYNQN